MSTREEIEKGNDDSVEQLVAKGWDRTVARRYVEAQRRGYSRVGGNGGVTNVPNKYK